MIKINLLPGSGKKAAARRQSSFKVGGGGMSSGLMSGIKDKFYDHMSPGDIESAVRQAYRNAEIVRS